MKDIAPILSSLGLQDSEIQTYLKALGNGPSTAAELSKLTKYSRQAVYTAIEALTNRALMSSVMRGKKRLYVSEPPENLLAYAKRKDQEMHEKVKELERIVPELKLQVGGERPIVRMFEGKDGLRAIIEDMKHSSSNRTLEITDVDAMFKVMTPEELEPMRRQVSRRKTRVRGIYCDAKQGSKSENIVKADRVYLSDKYCGFKSNIGVYGDNKVALVTFEGKMNSVIIESKALAKTMEILFDLAFKGAKTKK